MNASQPQTVVFVTSGVAHEPSRVFPHGTPVAPFSVGTQGDWAVLASGVDPVHLYIGFDGRELHVAAATHSARVFLDGGELVAGWHNLRLGSELRFGAACFMASGEVQRPTTQPLGRVNEPHTVGQPLRTQLIERPLPLTQPAVPGRSEPPLVEADRAPVLGFVPVQAAPHVQGAQGWQPVGAGPGHPFESTAKWHTPSGAAASSTQATPAHPHATQVMSAQAVLAQPSHGQSLHEQPSPAQPKLKPSPSVALGPQQALPPSPAQAPLPTASVQAPLGAPNPDGARGAASFPGPGLGYDPLSGPSTIADGGALREHAARVAAATPSIAFRSAQAYAEEVRRASGSTPVPAGQAAAPEAAAPIPSPGWPGGAPPQGFVVAPRVSLPDAEPAPKKPSALVRSWREASLVKKITLALLPLGLAGVALMPDEPAPAPVAPKRAATPRASTSASAGTSPSAMVAAGDASAVPTAPSASASPSVAASSVVVPSATPSPSAVSIEIANALPSASAAVPAARALSATSERDALNAAFEGRNADAARIYERIAKARGEKAFALAAHLVRENIVLKPAISH